MSYKLTRATYFHQSLFVSNQLCVLETQRTMGLIPEQEKLLYIYTLTVDFVWISLFSNSVMLDRGTISLEEHGEYYCV